jgi:alpha-tubulin suppressor-like RCC1 family protein
MQGISNVIAIAAGYHHTTALTADKRLWTWGGNGSGQLGNGTTTNLLTPTPLLMSNVVAIAAGNQFTLAVTNGHVYAWGDNSKGQLGANPSNVGSISSPMLVGGISNVVRVSASNTGSHSMAMTVDQGTEHVWGWGYNYDGEVGNGTNSGNYSGTSYNQYSPAQLQFCTRCQRCVQLGTSGSFTAQCNGTLYLYFNGQIGKFDGNNYSGSYSVTMNNLTNIPVQANSGSGLGISPTTPGQGVSFGAVTNGGTYPYSATGICEYANVNIHTDPNGVDTITRTNVDCSNFAYINITNAVCPMWQCFSLVGKIQ